MQVFSEAIHTHHFTNKYMFALADTGKEFIKIGKDIPLSFLDDLDNYTYIKVKTNNVAEDEKYFYYLTFNVELRKVKYESKIYSHDYEAERFLAEEYGKEFTPTVTRLETKTGYTFRVNDYSSIKLEKIEKSVKTKNTYFLGFYDKNTFIKNNQDELNAYLVMKELTE
jgi:hypothetical protein